MDREDSTQWDLGSDSSGDSTDAVVFVKPLPPLPPPSFQAEQGMGSESARLSSLEGHSGTSKLGEYHVAPVSLSLAKKPYVVGNEASEPQTFNTDQLRPAKTLRKSQHPAALTPGLGSRGDYGSGSSPTVTNFPTAVKPGPEARIAQHPETTPAGPSGAVSEFEDDGIAQTRHANRSGASNKSRDQNSHRPQRHTICASRSGAREEDRDARSNYCTVSPPREAHPFRNSTHSMREAGFTPENNQPSSQAQPYRPPPGNTVSVDGVEFEVVSPLLPTSNSARTTTSNPTPAPAPPPNGGRGRSQETRAASPHPRPRSPSPAYGAWQSDHPRQRRRSFIDRAQTRLQNSLHEHLVKAGRRPLPSFKVHSVTKTPSEDVGTRYEGKRPDIVPPPRPMPPVTKEEWLARVEKLLGPMRAKEGDSASATPAEKDKGNWAEPNSDRDNDGLFYAQEHPLRDSAIHLSMHAPNSAPNPHVPERKRATANSRVYTDVPNFSRPVVAEAVTPESYEYSSFTNLQKARLGGPRKDEDRGGEDGRAASKKASDDSLFLGLENNGPRNSAGYSFFSSDYSQKRTAADMERDEDTGRRQQRQGSLAQSAVGSSRDGHDGKAGSRKSHSPVALSREQVDYAALPSAFADLFRPFPFDDRRDLPSQARPRDAVREDDLLREKAVELE